MSGERKYFVGSTLFVLGNFIPNDPNPPAFIQFNFGYRITPDDVISVELKTWKYAWPLGIPYGPDFLSLPEKYPGVVYSYGVAFVYQRFIWHGLYSALHAMNSYQQYYDEAGNHLQNGFQLFMTYRLGYRVDLFDDHFFIEPSAAITHWPINTNVPSQFEARDRKWPNYFLIEPGLHVGYSF